MMPASRKDALSAGSAATVPERRFLLLVSSTSVSGRGEAEVDQVRHGRVRHRRSGRVNRAENTAHLHLER